jgi:hypothetical protein
MSVIGTEDIWSLNCVEESRSWIQAASVYGFHYILQTNSNVCVTNQYARFRVSY